MGAVYVFDDVLSGGSTPLSLSAGVLLVQGHGFMPAGQLTGPHRHSLTASCRVLAACAAGAQADPLEKMRVPSLSVVCVTLQRKSRPCKPWDRTTSLPSPPLRRMRLWSRSRQPQRLSQTAEESLESRLLLSYNAQVRALDICHVGSTQLLQICPSNEQWKKGALQADPAAGDPVLVQSCDLCSSPHTLAWHHSSMGRLLPACSGSAMQ